MQINESLLMIAGIVLLLSLMLNSLIFKPLVAILDERRELIEGGEEARLKSRKTVEENEAGYLQRVVEARRTAQSRRNQILKESEMVRDDIINSSKEKAMGMIQAAATDLEVQVKNAKASLKQETDEVAQKIVSSILAKASS